MYEMGSCVYEITPLLSILRLTTEKEGARLALLGHDYSISRAKDFLKKKVGILRILSITD